MKTRTAKSWILSCLVLLMGVLMIASMFLKAYSFNVQKGETFTIAQSGFEALFYQHAELGSTGMLVAVCAWLNLIAGIAVIVLALLEMVIFSASDAGRHLQTAALLCAIIASLLYAFCATQVCDVFSVREAFIWDASLSFVGFLGVAVCAFPFAVINYFNKSRE